MGRHHVSTMASLYSALVIALSLYVSAATDRVTVSWYAAAW